MPFSLMSPEFLALSITTALLLATLRGGARQAAFLAANFSFLWVLLLGPQGALSTVGFCLLGYILTRLILRSPRRGFPASVMAFVLLFIYMQNYYFLQQLAPYHMLTNAFRTIGLSFLFFKIVHVMIEARSGTLGTLELATYINYCLNFTTFMMGPIQRYQDYYAQWYGKAEAIPYQFEAHLDAVLRILVGFLKAYVVGDWIRPYIFTPGTNISELPLSALLIRTYAFYLYLYFNFAGYCDVVIGVGSLLGVRPPENFDKPFLARNISEFWLRMHRSLTLWLTDYIFSPLYKWTLRTRWAAVHPLVPMVFSLLVTMVVCGLWHGTTLSFLLFGLLHGMYLAIYRSWEMIKLRLFGRRRVNQWRKTWTAQFAGMVLTFNAVAIAFLFFQLDVTQALQVISRLIYL